MPRLMIETKGYGSVVQNGEGSKWFTLTSKYSHFTRIYTLGCSHLQKEQYQTGPIKLSAARYEHRPVFIFHTIVGREVNLVFIKFSLELCS